MPCAILPETSELAGYVPLAAWGRESVVFLIDGQPTLRKALSQLLDMAGLHVQAFDSVHDFMNSGNAAAPGCLVLDAGMQEMSAIVFLQILRDQNSFLPVIFLARHADVNLGVQAIKSGAADYMCMPVDGDRFIGSVRLAMGINWRQRAERAELDAILARFASLTPRERQVVHLITEGKLNKQVAAELGIVEKTIKVHRARVMAKMNVRSLSALVRLVDRVHSQG